MKSVKSRAFTGHKHGLSATSRVAIPGRKSVQVSALSVGDKVRRRIFVLEVSGRCYEVRDFHL